MTFGIAPSRQLEESEVVRGQLLLSAARLDVRAQLQIGSQLWLRRGYRDRNGETTCTRPRRSPILNNTCAPSPARTRSAWPAPSSSARWHRQKGGWQM